ncbi:MAG: tRNA dihydrouridine synthase DusB [Lachnospiraceae bacterium]|nr:tRNA dihydrouridine synthase DusB [Lachnospiraceae bacterium]
MKIGNVEIKNNIILAPMAGVTDLPFRLICKEMGCGLVYTEMVSAKAILYKNKNTEPLLSTDDREHPVAVQLFGSDPDIMGDMAAKIESERNFEIIDINMGCPVPKIVNNGEGSALMNCPDQVEKILKNIISKVHTPVTVKIRKGFNENSVNACEIAKIAESCGVSAVAIHGRTREQYYSGKADLQVIADVKKAVKIPVIGNGDICDVESAIRMYEVTGCDGIMVGRAARGNPWIFRQLSEYFENGRIIAKPGRNEVIDMILRHCRMLIEEKGEYTGIREMRKHVGWYTFGMPHSASIRGRVNTLESYDELEDMFNELRQ